MTSECATAVVFVIAATVLGATERSQRPTFAARVESVRVDALVTENGQPVPGLGPADFDVFDNGVRQDVDLVSFEQVPLDVVLVLDMSDSVAGERLDHLRSASDAALHEFECELAVADPKRLYGREYTSEAHYGRGSAFMDMQHTQQALAAFRQALDLDPDHVPTRLALVRAMRHCGQHSAVDSELTRVDEVLAVIDTTRPLDASLMRARRLVACTRLDEAIEILEQLLAQAPPGFAAWALPIDPLLRPLHGHEDFDRVLRQLATRAA